MRFYVLAFSGLLVTCAPHREDCGGHFRIDPGFSPEFRKSAHNIESRWNAFSKKKVSFEDGWGDTCTIKPTTTDSELHEDLEEENGTWGALYNRPSGNIFFCVDLTQDPAVFETAILHELGHTVWMDHVPKGPAIMTLTFSSFTFTQIDHVECWRVGACD